MEGLERPVGEGPGGFGGLITKIYNHHAVDALSHPTQEKANGGTLYPQ